MDNVSKWPRVTGILRDLGVMQGSPYYQPKHRRRGRIVDHCCNLLAQGKRIEADWWTRSSGETEEDKVEHESVRPFVEAYEAFLGETGFQLIDCAQEVVHHGERYIGHYDQLGRMTATYPDLIDIKTGDEADWHKLQLALYAAALLNQSIEQKWTIYLRRWNLYLTSDGKYRLVQHKDHRDIQQALCLARAWWIITPFKDWDFREVE